MHRDLPSLREARQRRDQQALHAERRPVALRVLDQLVGLADPHCLAAALKPVVEDDRGGLAAFANAGAVADHEAAPEAHGVRRIITRGGDDIEGGVNRPRSGEMIGVRLTGIDDGLELRVG